MNKPLLLAALVPLLVLAPTLSFAATSGIKSCDDNKSCVVTYKNGTQAVEISNAKFKCIANFVRTQISECRTELKQIWDNPTGFFVTYDMMNTLRMAIVVSLKLDVQIKFLTIDINSYQIVHLNKIIYRKL